MEQLKYLEEINVWEHPPYSGIVQKEEKNKKFFEENQTDSLLSPFQYDSTRDDEEAESDFWTLLQVISFIAIMWNPESNCTCRQKNHFLFHWSASMLPEPQIRHLMYCWEHQLMITGTQMEKENCQMHGQASQDSFYWMKGHLTDIPGPGRDLPGNKQPQDPTMYGQICGSICLMQREAKRSKSGLSRNQSSIMPEDHVVFISLILRTRSSKKPLGYQEYEGRVVLRGDFVKDD